MRWDAPDFIAFGEVSGYRVFSDSIHVEHFLVKNVSLEIELNGRDTAEEVYELFVTTDARGVQYRSATARCDITTVERGSVYAL